MGDISDDKSLRWWGLSLTNQGSKLNWQPRYTKNPCGSLGQHESHEGKTDLSYLSRKASTRWERVLASPPQQVGESP